MTREFAFEFVMFSLTLLLAWSYLLLAVNRSLAQLAHVSCMIWSYGILLMLIATYDPYHYDDWRVVPLGIALVLGTIGISLYYKKGALRK